jgi:hypothetical protein
VTYEDAVAEDAQAVVDDKKQGEEKDVEVEEEPG